MKDQCQIRKTVLRQRDINKDKSGGKKVGNVRTMEVLLIYQKVIGGTRGIIRESIGFCLRRVELASS